jgi:hypothetical protein
VIDKHAEYSHAIVSARSRPFRAVGPQYLVLLLQW